MTSATDTSAPTPASGIDIRVVAVVGPTAVGKTSFAEKLAVLSGGEIVSADSMQVYRGMDIGTAKPPVEERRVPYHCLDIADPREAYSAALFQRAARSAIAGIAARGRVPVVVGGTGLYVRAALDALDFAPGDSTSPERRAYERFAAENGPEALHALLQERDPGSAAVIHPNNVRRVIRALEFADKGESYAETRSRFTVRRSLYDTVFFGLTMERSLLYERIDARVDEMMRLGLLGEVERLLAAGVPTDSTAMQAIGYKELADVVEGRAELAEAVAAIKQASRRYAKRQLTWFRADPRIHWIDVTTISLDEAVEIARCALD
ncbi:MAG: tRNA (adenosine(37)-N6)-dimethylallyltransferase MiaA [Coriobacteriia bacterium]